jgi:hypothetical protein
MTNTTKITLAAGLAIPMISQAHQNSQPQPQTKAVAKQADRCQPVSATETGAKRRISIIYGHPGAASPSLFERNCEARFLEQLKR